MKESTKHKLAVLSKRHEDIAQLLTDGAIIADQNQFRQLSQEYAQLTPITDHFRRYQACVSAIEEAYAMLQEDDQELRDMARQELIEKQSIKEELALTLNKLLLPTDTNDKRNIFIEVRAGTGGDEAALFAGDLYRMYSRYAETCRWQVELINVQEGDHGGYKEVIMRIIGEGAYSRLKFESGGHRVQRVPETESQGRIHTSACTVAILPEVDEINQVAISPADLRVDTFRARGAGGQHVNKTDSAIRLTHLPTGIVVECQDQRSQHKNRAQAMAVLQARIMAKKQQKLNSQQAETRKLQVGSGDRSERIRTYNFPQGRLTDHRINLTLYKLADIMAGNLDQVIEPLVSEYQTEQLAFLDKA